MTDQEKDQKLDEIEREVSRIETILEDLNKEVSSKEKSEEEKQEAVDIAQQNYNNEKKKYDDAVEVWQNASLKSELETFQAKRGIGSDSSKIASQGGKRVRHMLFRSKDIYFDRAAPRKAVRQFGTSLFLLFDEPNHTKITNAFNNRTGNQALVANTWNDTNYPLDDIDVRAGFAIKHNNNYYYHTDTNHTNARTAGPTQYSVEWVERWWKRYKDYFTNMVAVADQNDFNKEIVADIPGGKIPIRNAGKWIQKHANDKQHVENILFGGNVKNYVPLTIQKPFKDFNWNYHMGVNEVHMLDFYQFLFPETLNIDDNKLVNLVTNHADARLNDTKYLDQDYSAMCIYPVYSEEDNNQVSEVELTDIIDQKNNKFAKEKMDNDFVKSNGNKVWFKKWGSYNMANELKGKGFKGYVQAFNELFATGSHFRNELITFCGTTDATKIGSFRALDAPNYSGGKSTFLTSSGELISVEKPTREALRKAEEELEKAKDALSVEDTKVIKEQIKGYNKSLAELRAKKRELTGNTVSALWRHIKGRVGKLANTDANKRGKHEISYYEDFRSDLKKLEDALWETKVKDHLKKKDEERDAWNLFEKATETDFPSGEKDFTKDTLKQIKDAWSYTWGKKGNDDGCAKVAVGLYSKLNDKFHAKLNKIMKDQKKDWDKALEEWLKDSKNAKVSDEILDIFEKLDNHIYLTIEDKDIRDKIKASPILIKSLEGMIEKIFRGKKPKVVTRWKTAGYGEDDKFFKLITDPEDISKSKAFMDFVKAEFSYTKGFKDWLEETEDIDTMVSTIMRYRIKHNYMQKSLSDREEIDAGKVLDWFATLKKHGGVYDDLDNTPEGKTPADVEKGLVRRVGKAIGEALGLDVKIESEMDLILKWRNELKDSKKYSEKIASVKDDEEFKKKINQEYKTWIKSKGPADAVAEVCRFKIEKTGITEENLSEVKKDKEVQLEEVESNLIDLQEIGKINEVEKTLLQKVQAHKATLQTEVTPKAPETPKEEPKEKGEETTPKGEEDKSKEKEGDKGEKKWWQKGGYAAIWAPLLLLAVIGGLGYFLGWWGGKKEGEEETGVAETEKEEE